MALRVDEWRLKISENVSKGMAKLTASSESAAAKFTRTQDRITQSIGRASAGIKSGLSGAWQGAKESIGQYKSNLLSALPLPPAMGSALGALAGPLGIAVALTGALALGMVKGVQAAEAFGVPFRELRNLNMDLDAGGIAQLKTDLLDLSKAKGLDPQKVTAGYYDIQSATGQTGKAVLDLVGRVGEASRALNMDMATSVNGVGKAMVAFGLQTQDLDMLLESNAKTVQMGIVTFDQLAKAQTEYAGAAAAVNQNVNTANKLFAIFTQHTKSAEIAATYTKGAFAELTRDATVKGLKKIGVSVFDANKNMRQADDILRDLVPQLSTMSDQTFSKLKEEIGGSEGLRGLLDAAKASGADTLRVLDGFDSSKFSVNDAIKNANGDLDVMKEKLSNQLQVQLIKIGELMMPMVVSIVSGISSLVGHLTSAVHVLMDVAAWFRNVYDNSTLVRVAVQQLFLTIKVAWTALVTAIKLSFNALLTPIKALGQALTGDFSGAWQTMRGGMEENINLLKGGAASIGDSVRNSMAAVAGKPAVITAQLDASGLQPAINGLTAKVMPELMAPAPKGVPINPPVKDGVNKSMRTVPTALKSNAQQQLDASAPKADPYARLFTGSGGKGDGASGAVKQGVNAVAGGGGTQRSVTVNIQSLVREVKIYNTGGKLDANEIKRSVEQALIQAVQGAELATAND